MSLDFSSMFLHYRNAFVGTKNSLHDTFSYFMFLHIKNSSHDPKRKLSILSSLGLDKYIFYNGMNYSMIKQIFLKKEYLSTLT